MSLLSGPRILELVREGVLVLDPLPADGDVNPNSVNLRLGDRLRVYQAQLNFLQKFAPPYWSPGKLLAAAATIDADCVLDPYKVNPTVDLVIPPTGLILVPGIFYIGHTAGRAGSNTRYAPMISGRSTFARLSFQSEKSAGFGDVAFCRSWVLEIEVSTPLVVRPGDPVCQVAFHEVEGPERLYTDVGRYADQEGPTAARPLPKLE